MLGPMPLAILPFFSPKLFFFIRGARELSRIEFGFTHHLTQQLRVLNCATCCQSWVHKSLTHHGLTNPMVGLVETIRSGGDWISRGKATMSNGHLLDLVRSIEISLERQRTMKNNGDRQRQKWFVNRLRLIIGF